MFRAEINSWREVNLLLCQQSQSLLVVGLSRPRPCINALLGSIRLTQLHANKPSHELQAWTKVTKNPRPSEHPWRREWIHRGGAWSITHFAITFPASLLKSVRAKRPEETIATDHPMHSGRTLSSPYSRTSVVLVMEMAIYMWELKAFSCAL